jgi:hypothetical protein
MTVYLAALVGVWVPTPGERRVVSPGVGDEVIAKKEQTARPTTWKPLPECASRRNMMWRNMLRIMVASRYGVRAERPCG